MKSLDPILATNLEHMPVSLALIRTVEQHLFRRYQLVPPVLDVGCGDGVFGAALARAQNTTIAVGVDPDPVQAEKARHSTRYERILVADTTELPFPDGHFRTIISNCVFEHIPHLDEVFREVGRLLAPGGRFIFTAHSHHYADCLFWPPRLRRVGLSRMARWYEQVLNWKFKHFKCLSPEDWGGHLLTAGMRLSEHEYYFGPEAMGCFDLMLPWSLPAALNYRCFGRYTLLPRGLVRWLWGEKLQRLINLKEERGGALLMVATK